MPSALLALEVVDIAGERRLFAQHRSDCGVILAVEPKRRGADGVVEMGRAPRADDDRGHLRLRQHPRHGDRADPHVVFRGDAADDRQQALEPVPATELVDDEPVLHERAVGERIGRRHAEPARREEAAGERAVTEQADAARLAQPRHGTGRTLVEQRVLHLVRHDRHTGVEDRPHRGRVAVGQTQVPDLAGLLPFSQPAGRVEHARALVVPPVELHEVEHVHAESCA